VARRIGPGRDEDSAAGDYFALRVLGEPTAIGSVRKRLGEPRGGGFDHAVPIFGGTFPHVLKHAAAVVQDYSAIVGGRGTKSDRAGGHGFLHICRGPGRFLKGYNISTKENAGSPRGFMYEVTVEDTFAAGHYLRNYKGKCENPHGHNYKVRVTLAGAELDKAGLLLDFKDLKDVIKHVIDRLDHQMINDIEPFTVLNPSAENLAKYFYDETNTRLRTVTNGRVAVRDVTIFETDTTTAKYSE